MLGAARGGGVRGLGGFCFFVFFFFNLVSWLVFNFLGITCMTHTHTFYMKGKSKSGTPSLPGVRRGKGEGEGKIFVFGGSGGGIVVGRGNAVILSTPSLSLSHLFSFFNFSLSGPFKRASLRTHSSSFYPPPLPLPFPSLCTSCHLPPPTKKK